MGIFGWDLPPGCRVSDIPGNRPEDELAEAVAEGYRLTCSACKSFLSFTPDRTEVWEDGVDCNGIPNDYGCCPCGFGTKHEPHREVFYAGTTGYYICKKCGTETKYEL